MFQTTSAWVSLATQDFTARSNHPSNHQQSTIYLPSAINHLSNLQQSTIYLPSSQQGENKDCTKHNRTTWKLSLIKNRSHCIPFSSSSDDPKHPASKSARVRNQRGAASWQMVSSLLTTSITVSRNSPKLWHNKPQSPLSTLSNSSRKNRISLHLHF